MEGILASLSTMEEAKVAVDKLAPGPVVSTIHREDHQDPEFSWDHIQVAQYG